MGTGLGRHVNADRGGRRADTAGDHAKPAAEIMLRRLEVVFAPARDGVPLLLQPDPLQGLGKVLHDGARARERLLLVNVLVVI